MSQQGSPAAVQDTTRTSAHSVTTEINETAFSTTGQHPQAGIAITRLVGPLTSRTKS